MELSNETKKELLKACTEEELREALLTRDVKGRINTLGNLHEINYTPLRFKWVCDGCVSFYHDDHGDLCGTHFEADECDALAERLIVVARILRQA